MLRKLLSLELAAVAVVLYHRPVGMLIVYLRDRHDFPRQRAAVYAAITSESEGVS